LPPGSFEASTTPAEFETLKATLRLARGGSVVSLLAAVVVALSGAAAVLTPGGRAAVEGGGGGGGAVSSIELLATALVVVVVALALALALAVAASAASTASLSLPSCCNLRTKPLILGLGATLDSFCSAAIATAAIDIGGGPGTTEECRTGGAPGAALDG